MTTSIATKTFLLFLIFQAVTSSLSIWIRSLGWYSISILTIIIPIALVSIVWPLLLRNEIGTVTSRAVLSTSIAGICGIVVSNVVVYVLWFYVSRDGDLSSIWGKDFDVLKLQLFANLLIFIVLHLLSFVLIGRKVIELLQRD